MRILITACNGQLGTDAVSYFSKTCDVIAYKDIDLDITDEKKVTAAVSVAKPDIIINCAAITNVDGCEDNRDLAFQVNSYGAGVVATVAAKFDSAIVHISTDYVFEGVGNTPYKETDHTNPQGVYGLSKLDGEKKVLEACNKSYILRTAWLYGPHGNNFVKTMLKIGAEKGEVGVVTDQVGNPTSTFELIRMINAVIKSGKYGIYHATCDGICSWNEFAREIFNTANLNVIVKNVTSEQFARRARRPSFSGLNKEKLIANTGYQPAKWRDALKEYFAYENGLIAF